MNAKEKRILKLRVIESIRLDLSNQCLWRGNRRIALRPKDYAVLQSLMEHAEQLVTKTALLDAVWPEIIVTEAVLKACINRLRQALGDDAQAPQYIETVHRRGYRLLQPIPTTQPVARRQYPVGSKKAMEFRSQEIESRSPALLSQHPTLSTQHSVLVGREAELAQLHQWLERALSGE